MFQLISIEYDVIQDFSGAWFVYIPHRNEARCKHCNKVRWDSCGITVMNVYHTGTNLYVLFILWHLMLNTVRPRRNRIDFAYDIFECIFLWKVLILIKISLKFIPKGPINNIPALIIIIGSDNGSSPERRQAFIWTNDDHFTDAYMRHSASMS